MPTRGGEGSASHPRTFPATIPVQERRYAWLCALASILIDGSSSEDVGILPVDSALLLPPAIVLAIAAVVLSIVASRAEDDHGHPVDTQAAGQHPPTPQEALHQLRVPPGFQVTLAAAEPMVRQPIAIDFDDRGRLWVAECYSYDGSDFTEEKRDRILIFEDADGDGTLEKRTVFQDGLNRLTGLARGFGGVWITAPPNVSWIPDRDGDDRPDGPPVVHLDGWTLRAEHNSVNGLTWGPDGWLYGRHGIKQPSLVGRPAPPVRTGWS